jgi:hypothetical protein
MDENIYNATDVLIKNKYAPLFSDMQSSLLKLLDDLEGEKNGKKVINSIDFFHLHGFLWNDHQTYNDFENFRNYWIFESLRTSPPSWDYNLVVSRATFLELVDSIIHEIERLGKVKLNEPLFHQARKGYIDLEKMAFGDSEEKMSYLKTLGEYRDLLPSFSISSNIENTIELFKTKKLVQYNDVLPAEDIRRLRPKVNQLANAIAEKSADVRLKKGLNAGDMRDRAMHLRIDARNFSTAKIIGEEFRDIGSYFITPNGTYKFDDLKNVRRSVYTIALKIKGVLENFDNKNIEIQSYVHLGKQIGAVLEVLRQNSKIPRYILEDIQNIRKITMNLFYNFTKMNGKGADIRRRLIMSEGSDKEVVDLMGETQASYENTVRAILKDEATGINEELLYDLDLQNDSRAKEIMKKYGML